jgi:hypothetical protein
MATDNVTPIRPTPPTPPEPDQFDRIHDGMQAQLDAVRCVETVLTSSTDIDVDEELAAARSLLHRAFRELDRLHTELEEWHMRAGAERQP